MRQFTTELTFGDDNAPTATELNQAILDAVPALFARTVPEDGDASNPLVMLVNGDREDYSWIAVVGPHAYLGDDDEVEDSDHRWCAVEDLNDARRFYTANEAVRGWEAYDEQVREEGR